MKNLLLGVVLVLALAACTDKRESAPKPAAAADIAAGKLIADRDCKTCHGANGGGVAPAIPHLAAQRERYLLASLMEYKEGKRAHAALKDDPYLAANEAPRLARLAAVANGGSSARPKP